MMSMYLFLKKIFKKLLFSDDSKKFIRRTIKSVFFYKLMKNVNPISDYYGFDRGTPIDRFYIENFLKENQKDIKDVCLELLNDNYIKTFGGKNVTKGDILDIEETNKNATIIDDLRHLKKITDNTYDCIILTQVFQFIDDVPSAISECYRVLKKEGVLLATLPAMSRIDCISGTNGDYWRFTEAGARYLFEKHFSKEQLITSTHGNVRSGMYFYAGFSQEDVSTKILTQDDKNFPLIVTVKATK